ncbi:MAG: hypothetical protein JKY48_03945 [Flavobacteriales bacterium]|nr:hypothetical protein [Flavobacteriales bacterium]
MNKFKLLTLLAIVQLQLFAQLKPIGSWTDHLPYQKGTSIATDGVRIFAGTKTGLFTYNTDDNSISKYSKVNLLSDVEISKMAYSNQYKTLVIVYANANIDLIINDRVVNVPFIKLSDEKKQVNEIKIINNLAYLSTIYGISVIDIVKKEIVDTYKFGINGNDINVNSCEVLANTIYAATNSGLFLASQNTNLLDFNSWSKVPYRTNKEFKKLWQTNSHINAVYGTSGTGDTTIKFDNNLSFTFLNQLSNTSYISLDQAGENTYIFNTSDKTFFLDTLNNVTKELNKSNLNLRVIGSTMTHDGKLFDINTYTPLLARSSTDGSILSYIRPSGPFEASIFDIDIVNGNLWAVAGGVDGTYNNRFQFVRIYNYNGVQWTSYLNTEPSLDGLFDAVSVTINPENENNVFFGTWVRGLIEYRNKKPFITYKDTNTLYEDRFGSTVPALRIREALKSDKWLGVGESAFDKEGNLWMTNTYQKNGMAVRKQDGSWFSYDFSPFYSADETTLYDIEVDDNGYKWVVLAKDNSIIVYDDNGTIEDISDDRSIKLSSEVGKGSVPGGRGIKIEKDNDGLMWIGTSDGIAVHFNPSGVFDGDRDFDRIIFFDGENNEVVLKNSIITDIAIDGFNRKWIATENSGVLLLSEDGKETIFKFNEDNSPLISNAVNAIAVDDKSGEVYFATSKGLVSYRAEAISGSEDLTNILVYPNPVRPDYKGQIAISGLINNSTVKITDISGRLINELKSQGGQVLWNGNNFEGRRASTGVYLIFISGEDEDQDLQTEVGKIMFVN